MRESTGNFREEQMNLKKGEIWVCTEPMCQVEIEVVRSAKASCHGKFTLRCCCGKELVLKENVGHTGVQAEGQDDRPSRHS
jgi:hypothetical protein